MDRSSSRACSRNALEPPRVPRFTRSALALALGLAALVGCGGERRPAAASSPAVVAVQLAGVDEEVPIVLGEDGAMRFVLDTAAGPVALSAEEFARRVYREQADRAWWSRLFNITSLGGLLWVGLGFLGQALFTGRMLVQWLASERLRRSVVPVAFWWLSLAGASMLLVYFVWRKDAVGVLGQGTGWVIYVRNLWLLHLGRTEGAGAP